MAGFLRYSYAGGMNDLNHLYRDLLGLNDPGNVDDVDLDLTGTQLVIHPPFAESELSCLDCGATCPRADAAPVRTCRQLDTMQSTTEIRGTVPRCRCQKCGVKTIRVPLAGKHSRFTERTMAACESLWESLAPERIASVRSVTMDMWQAFMSSAAKNVPWAKIVHDKFHVARYLGEAVDKVRRSEHRELRKDGDSPLTGLRKLFLFNEEKLDGDAYFEVLTVQRADLKTGPAWAIKENFRHFWTYSTRAWGARFFDRWYAWTIRSGLDPVKNVEATLNQYRSRIRTVY